MARMGLLQFLGLAVAATPVTDAAVAAVTAPQSPSRGLAPRPRPVGGAGTLLRAGVIDSDDPNREVQGSLWYGQPGRTGWAAKMLRDPHVRQSVAYVTAPLRAASWRFRPADESELAREIADFCQWAFIESMPWDEILRRMVSGYVVHGFSLQELTDDARPLPAGRFPGHRGPGVGIVPTGVHDRPAWTVKRWLQSQANPAQLSGVEQWIVGSDGEAAGFRVIPGDRLLRLTCEQEGANFEGLPILRSAYGAWKLKTTLAVIDAMKHERFALGVPWAKAPEDAPDEDIDAAEQALSEFRAHERLYLMLPAGWDVGILASNQGDGTDIATALERCNKDIAINVAAGFALLGLTGRSGSYALAATQQGFYHLSTVGHAKSFANAWNFGSDGWSPVRRIVELNYGAGAPVPRLEAHNLPTRDWPEVIKLAVMAKQADLLRRDLPTEARLRDMLELDPLVEDDAAPLFDGGDEPTAGTEPTVEPGAAAIPDEMPTVANATSPNDETSRDPEAVSPTEALNGAQVGMLRQIMLDVATRQLPRESGVRAIAAAFPLSEAEADRVMGEIGRTFFVDAVTTPSPFASLSAEGATDDAPADADDEEDADA
jgi:hypothetical protein